MKRLHRSGPAQPAGPAAADGTGRTTADRTRAGAGAGSVRLNRSHGSGSTRADRDARSAGRRTPAGDWADVAPRRATGRPATGRRAVGAPVDDRDVRRGDVDAPRRGGSGRGPEDTRPPSQLDRDEYRGRRPGATMYARTTALPQPTPKAAQRPPKNAAKSVRGRRSRPMRQAPGRPDNRIKAVLVALLVMLLVAVVKLTFIQGWSATAYAEKAFDQRTRETTVVAERGTISDRNGTPLAFTVEGKAIAGRPYLFVNDEERQKVVDALVAAFGARVDAVELMAQLKSDDEYVYLVRGLMPAEADKAMAVITPILASYKSQLDPKYAGHEIDGVATEPQQLREYPDGGVYKPVVGNTSSWDGDGTMGIENRFNSLLAGTDGKRTVEVSPSGVIPGSAQILEAAVDGSDLTVTLDADLQYSVTQMLQSYVDQTGAKRGMAEVQDVQTGEIYSLATYEPGVDAGAQSNIAVSAPFEPGSVNKVVTFAAALEAGLITPTSVSSVDGEIQMGGSTIHDAWEHGPIDMTATGILAKSSNVGTLQIAQQLGPDAFAAELNKMGLGQKTGIELSGESPGVVPDQEQWSSTSFANLPIGQGLSMTLVQMASMYQAIGNGGVKLPPTLVKGTTTDGSYTPAAPAAGTPVMSGETADTLVDMLRGTTQDGDVAHRGTAAAAAITGYQVAAKTGTAQQVDPTTNDYSKTMFNSTIAGLVPADNPRFVVAIMLDAPQGGKNAVPLFHDIAAYAMRAFDVAPSAEPAPVYDLYVPGQ
ncbi:peptidoglycan D,D-transpeptidase FtsI family protein [Nakamurella deserti]|uniref:peptidoglycan D,D-transpeptidase FtsI family protein n=1 Tax=Nakamurella deserti TaxID=2164074 RepID=UPI000DBEA6F6|nr:penicillin-binding protein 2 [Nakamurella deserti]